MTLAAAALVFAACSEDSLDKESIFQDSAQDNATEFDSWIYDNLTLPYNIRLIYKMSDLETDFSYTLTPAAIDKSMILAKAVKYCWLGSLDETAGIDFTRAYVPKELQFIGSAGWSSNGSTMLAGSAEGGLKVTLYMVNSLQLSKNYLNENYFKTMYHEFTHILTQVKDYSEDFQQISEGDYLGGDWYAYIDTWAHYAGFVSPYAMSEYNEDWAETAATYITYDDSQWSSMLDEAGSDGRDGDEIILRKLSYVRNYFRDSWGIDLDELRRVSQRRITQATSGVIDLQTL